MSSAPKTIEGAELAVNALQLMRQHNISQLVVTNKGTYDGIIHIQDLLKEGII
jgi:arabinose-5-phosphate isomerase